MTSSIYTAVTFAPVQGFIEKSRKLRDLYGSSYLLSYLSWAICQAAKGYRVVSPALPNVTQGMPNQIIIAGAFDEQEARAAFYRAWGNIVDGCRIWIEEEIPDTYIWQRNWDLWKNHAWEFFWAIGCSITEAREAVNEKKRSRDWTGINWTGESSTLSGADGIAWHEMGISSLKQFSLAGNEQKIETFYKHLSDRVGEAIISIREHLSIPELIKRLITLPEVAKYLGIAEKDLPKSFSELNRHLEDTPEATAFEVIDEIIRTGYEYSKKSRYSGWFQGDGDKAGKLLQDAAEKGEEESIISAFSLAMRQWGANLDTQLPKSKRKRYATQKNGRDIETDIDLNDGRIIYAGGDDLLGVLYRNHPDNVLTGYECIQWFFKFESEQKDTIWKQHQQPISISMGFVWAAPNIPQRDVLQHCREAEKSAKHNGRDRLAIRILFNGGNYLEWVCPWWLLNILEEYRDRTHNYGNKANWSHIYEDVAILESRHAFTKKIDKDFSNLENRNESKKQIQIALSIIEIYFPERYQVIKNSDYWFEHCSDDGFLRTGILGATKNEVIDSLKNEGDSIIEIERKVNKWMFEKLNNWVIGLAKVGFHLCR